MSVPNYFVTTLRAALQKGGSETEVDVNDITTPDGQLISLSDFAKFGSGGTLIVNPRSKDTIEYIGFTGVDNTNKIFSPITRGKSFKDSAVIAANKRYHPVGTRVIIGFGTHDLANLADLWTNQSFAGIMTFLQKPLLPATTPTGNEAASANHVASVLAGVVGSATEAIAGTAKADKNPNSLPRFANVLVQQQSTPGLTLKVLPFKTAFLEQITDYIGGNSGSFTAPAANPRIDLLVYATGSSALAIRSGSENASPVAPSPSSGDIVLAQVYNRVGQTAVYDTDQTTNGYIQKWFPPQVYRTDLLVTANKFQFPAVIAGENITVGKPVYMDILDQKAYTSHGFKANGTPTLAGGYTGTLLNECHRLNATQFLRLSFSAANLYLNIFNKTTGALVASSNVAANFDSGAISEQITRADAVRISDTGFIVFWSCTTTGKLQWRTGTVSGATITWDAVANDYTGPQTYVNVLSATEGNVDGKVILAFNSQVGGYGTGNGTLYFKYLTIAANSLTETYTVSAAKTAGAFALNTYWVSTAFTRSGIGYALFRYSDGSQISYMSSFYIDTNTGNTGADMQTHIPIVKTTSTTLLTTSRCVLIPGDSTVFTAYTRSYALSGPQYTKHFFMEEISMNGSVVTPLLFSHGSDTDPTEGGLYMIGNANGFVIFIDPVVGSAIYTPVYIQRGKRWGFSTPITTLPGKFNSWYMIARDEVMLINGTTMLDYMLPTPVDGFSDATVLAAASVNVLRQVISGLTLTAGKVYFLKDTYTTVGDLDTRGVIPVGKSLSATQLDYNPNIQ